MARVRVLTRRHRRATLRLLPRTGVSPTPAARYLFVIERESRARRPSSSRGLRSLLLTTVGIFVLALVLVTGAELLIGHPLSGGRPGQTTMTALFASSSGP